MRGDRLIQATARIIQDAVVEFDPGPRASSATSAATTSSRSWTPTIAEDVAKRICERFDEARDRVLRGRGPRARVRPDGGPQGRAAGHPARRDLGRDREHRAARVRPLRRGGGGGDRDEVSSPSATPGSSYAVDRRTDLNALGSAWTSRGPLYTCARKPVSGAGCNSPPAVTVRDPARSHAGWTRCDSGTDRESRDGRRRARRFRASRGAAPRRRSRLAPEEG